MSDANSIISFISEVYPDANIVEQSDEKFSEFGECYLIKFT